MSDYVDEHLEERIDRMIGELDMEQVLAYPVRSGSGPGMTVREMIHDDLAGIAAESLENEYRDKRAEARRRDE